MPPQRHVEGLHVHATAWHQRAHACMMTYKGSQWVLGMPPDKADELSASLRSGPFSSLRKTLRAPDATFFVNFLSEWQLALPSAAS